MSLTVIGLTGFKQSGKTSLAKAIVANAEVSASIYSFASPLKQVCHILFGGTEDHWYGDLKTEKLGTWGDLLGEKYSTPRRIMQTMGTEVMRNCVNYDVWLYVAQRFMADMHKEEGADLIVVDDVRFDNEAEFICAAFGGSIVHIRKAGSPPPTDTHVSERSINSKYIDYTFTAYTPQDLNLIAKTILSKTKM